MFQGLFGIFRDDPEGFERVSGAFQDVSEIFEFRYVVVCFRSHAEVF